MRQGLCLPNGGPFGDAGRLAVLGQEAETAGWNGVFLEDYIVWQGHDEVATFDPWIALAAIACATTRLRIGLTVAALPRRRPWNVAKAAVTLDHLSGGRLTLGAGVGDVMSDDRSFRPFGDESLAILDGLWSGSSFSFDGDHYRLGPVRLRPRPVQRPRIPLWIGGGYPLEGPVRRALRWDGSCLYVHAPRGTWRDRTAEQVRALRRRTREERGDELPFDIVVGGRRRGADEDAERVLIGSLAEAGATWWIEYIPPDAGTFDEVRAHVARGPLLEI